MFFLLCQVNTANVGYGLIAMDGTLNICGVHSMLLDLMATVLAFFGKDGAVNIYRGKFIASENLSCIASLPSINIQAYIKDPNTNLVQSGTLS